MKSFSVKGFVNGALVYITVVSAFDLNGAIDTALRIFSKREYYREIDEVRAVEVKP